MRKIPGRHGGTLIPLGERSKEELQAIGRKGGQKRTEKKKISQKMRRIRERIKSGQLRTEDEQWLYERCTDPEMFALSVLQFVDEIRSDANVQNNADLKIKTASLYNNVFKSIHGERVKTESVNINVDVTVDEYIEQIHKKRTA